MGVAADPETPVRSASLKALIAAAGEELSALARDVLSLQALIGAHVEAPGWNARSVEDAQLLDSVLQHQEGLAEVLTRLAAQIPSATEVDLEPVLGGLRLSGLAERLAGGEGPSAGAAGELEVF